MDPQITTILNILNNPSYALLLSALMVWVLAWKGFALWRAAQSGQRNWFIALLIINSLGILEIAYLFYFQGRKRVENMSGEK